MKESAISAGILERLFGYRADDLKTERCESDSVEAPIILNGFFAGCLRTICIDVGKTFLAGALEFFPMYGLSRIDAVLLTHAHADGALSVWYRLSKPNSQTYVLAAVNGLDDLRGWTLGGAIQSHIDIYLTQTTFVEVNRMFPYLVRHYVKPRRLITDKCIQRR